MTEQLICWTIVTTYL